MAIESSLRVLGLLPTTKAAVPELGRGEKWTIGADGVGRVELDGERFSKSAVVTPAEKSDLAKSMAKMILTHRKVMRVVNPAFAMALSLVKRADMRVMTEGERQGAAPPVRPGSAANDGPGLSDADVLALENVVGVTAYEPAAAQKLFAEAYRVISAHPGRRISETGDDAYGITPAPSAGDYHN